MKKTTTVFLHRDKESNWETGEELGLSEDVIRDKFAYALYEVAVEIEVDTETGDYKILRIQEVE